MLGYHRRSRTPVHPARRAGRPVRLTALATLAAAALPLTAVLGPAPGASAEAGAGTSPAASASAAPSVQPSARTRAERTLADVQRLLGGGARSAARAQVGASPVVPQDASLLLRDLWRQRSALPAAQRATADAVLARPKSTRVTCGVVCVHWTATGPDRSTRAYVDRVLTVMGTVRDVYARSGYRRPPSDGRAGGSSLFDVYLLDLGSQGLYGFCQPEKVAATGTRTATSYCALDNDFSSTQFPSNDQADNLRVTAAHEYFHAVQYAYDYAEDRWLMESTAAWAEDEVYTDVNDNRQYLAASQLKYPDRSIDDLSTPSWEYGGWIFFRYLTERYPTRQGSMPRIMRQLWSALGTNRGEGKQYSVQGISTVLASRGASLATVYADYAFALRHPSLFREGAGYTRYEGFARWSPSVAGDLTDTVSGPFKHLSSSSGLLNARYVSSGKDVRIDFDLPPTAAGSRALVDVRRATSHQLVRVALNSSGDATLTVPTSQGGVRTIEVIAVNAGGRYDCNQDTELSCEGDSLDDGQVKITFTPVTPRR